jgi:hypothetical protein
VLDENHVGVELGTHPATRHSRLCRDVRLIHACVASFANTLILSSSCTAAEYSLDVRSKRIMHQVLTLRLLKCLQSGNIDLQSRILVALKSLMVSMTTQKVSDLENHRPFTIEGLTSSPTKILPREPSNLEDIGGMSRDINE